MSFSLKGLNLYWLRSVRCFRFQPFAPLARFGVSVPAKYRGTTRRLQTGTAKDITKDPTGRTLVESLPLVRWLRRRLANSESQAALATIPAGRTQPERYTAPVHATSHAQRDKTPPKACQLRVAR